MSETSAAIDESIYRAPFVLTEWIDAHRHELQPPVGNKMIYPGRETQFKIMVVGGPNVRTDYHINTGEEWFWMLKGDMVLRVVNGGEYENIVIREGETFLLPPLVPHSPQRLSGTIGIVVERERLRLHRSDTLSDGRDDLDGLRWYCRQCGRVTYEEWFRCEDLGAQLKVRIADYYSDTAKRTCKHCGAVDTVGSTTASTVEDLCALSPSGRVLDNANEYPRINSVTHPPPRSLCGWIDANKSSLRPPVNNALMFGGDGVEFQVQIIGGPNNRTDYHVEEGEEWFYQLTGDMTLRVVDGGQHREIVIKEGHSFLLPANVPHSPQRYADTVGLVIERARRPVLDQSAPRHELDHLRWYCTKCRAVVNDDSFICKNLSTQLKAAINEYYGSIDKRTCKQCGTVDQVPNNPAKMQTH